MSNCNAEHFLGVWQVTLGSRDAEQITIEEGGASYQVSGTALSETVSLDEQAFTLKNERICLSLWQDCDQLFGAEGQGQSLEVWAATERVEAGAGTPGPPAGVVPDWTRPRTVRRRYPPPENVPVPPSEGDQVAITPGSGDLFDISVVGDEPYDSLRLNEGNRTLDTDDPQIHNLHRCVAKWDRTTSDCTFAMLVIGPRALRALRRALEAVRGWRAPDDWTLPSWRRFARSAEVLAVLREFRILPLELPSLIALWQSPQDGGGGGVVVWGADEG